MRGPMATAAGAYAPGSAAEISLSAVDSRFGLGPAPHLTRAPSTVAGLRVNPASQTHLRRCRTSTRSGVIGRGGPAAEEANGRRQRVPRRHFCRQTGTDRRGARAVDIRPWGGRSVADMTSRQVIKRETRQAEALFLGPSPPPRRRTRVPPSHTTCVLHGPTRRPLCRGRNLPSAPSGSLAPPGSAPTTRQAPAVPPWKSKLRPPTYPRLVYGCSRILNAPSSFFWKIS
jgi:hypothetical protein